MRTVDQIVASTEYQGFLTTIRRCPGDPFHKLVLADWLEEQGQSEWSAYLREQNGTVAQGEVWVQWPKPLPFPFAHCSKGEVEDGCLQRVTTNSIAWYSHHKSLYSAHPVCEVYLECCPDFEPSLREEYDPRYRHHRLIYKVAWNRYAAVCESFISESELVFNRDLRHEHVRYLQKQMNPSAVLSTLWPGVNFSPAGTDRWEDLPRHRLPEPYW